VFRAAHNCIRSPGDAVDQWAAVLIYLWRFAVLRPDQPWARSCCFSHALTSESLLASTASRVVSTERL
jgi:hypothetical protein